MNICSKKGILKINYHLSKNIQNFLTTSKLWVDTMKNTLQLTALFFVLLFLAAPLASAAGTITVNDNGVNKNTLIQMTNTCSDPTSSGYDLVGPVASGTITVIDNGNLTNGKKATLTDLVTINKDVVKNGTDYDVTMTVDVTPAELTYNPPPKLDVIIVLDVTSSMTNKRYMEFEGETKVRMDYALDALVNASEEIWAENPESTVTIIPFQADYFEPLPTGGLLFRGATAPVYDGGGILVSANDGKLLNYNYYKVNGSVDPVTFKAAIQALNTTTYNPVEDQNEKISGGIVGSGTNTESGLWLANEFLTDGTIPTTDANGAIPQKNRVVILITDGNPNYGYDHGNNNAVIWNSGRPSVLRWHDQVGDLATSIKDPSGGNAILYVMGIGHLYPIFNNDGFAGYNSTNTCAEGGTGDPYTGGTGTTDAVNYPACTELVDNSGSWLPANGWTYFNVTKELKTLASSPAHYSDPSDYSSIGPLLLGAVTSSTHFWAPVDDLYVYDKVNDGSFDYVASSVKIERIVDGNAPVNVTSSTAFTDAGGVLNISLGANPISSGVPLTSSSKTQYIITYQITPQASVQGDHLHTSIDNRSYVSFIAPDHIESKTNISVYTNLNNIYYVPFNTPTVPIGSVSIQKYVSTDGIYWAKSISLPKEGGTAYYKIVVTNGYDSTITLDRVNDKVGGTNQLTIFNDKIGSNLLEKAGVEIDGNSGALPVLALGSGQSSVVTYETDYTSSGTYKNMVVVKDWEYYNSTPSGDYDDPLNGTLKNSTATVTVASPGGGGSEGNATVVPTDNTTPPSVAEGYESDNNTTQLIIEKVDGANTSKKLTATFEIRDANGSSFNPKMVYTTNQSGHTEKIYLTHATTYTIFETSAPAGYVPIDGSIKVVVNDDLTIAPIDGYTLTNNSGVYTLTIPNEESCAPFAYTWVFLLVIALALVQSAFLYKKYKAALPNKWWIILAIMLVLVIATSIFIYANHCALSNVWIWLPVILALLMIPVIYLYNKYVPVKFKV
ncbi:VWA domain-containing protein [Methanolapillus africanus]|uniref:VWA domain-containing protein n=1 Tax=Methanolapillus africanus TaxID=3028297 RepID=UPI0030B88506